MFHELDRLALIIDGKNLSDSAGALGFSIDFKALLQSFDGKGRISDAIYSTICTDDGGHDPNRKKHDWMSYNGYSIITRARNNAHTNPDDNRLTAELNVELILAAVKRAQSIDHAVIFSGNGVFTPLVRTLKECGVRTTVISTRKTPSPFISDDLRREANHFLELDDLRAVIGNDFQQDAA